METKFKPFDKVLVRLCSIHPWRTELFGFYREGYEYAYVCMCNAYKYCIPYEGNEHLLGTTDDYVEPFEPKDGDFLDIHSMSERICIYQKQKDGVIYTYIDYSMVGRTIRNNQEDKDYYGTCYSNDVSTIRLATEEEKKRLLDALHEAGKDWDAKKKEIVDYKWKPKEGEEYFFPCFDGDDFYPEIDRWRDDVNSNNGFDKGWVISSEEECQALCDKLNEAIKNVK